MKVGEGRGCSGCWMDMWCGSGERMCDGAVTAPGRGEYCGMGEGGGWGWITWFERLGRVDASGCVGDCRKFEI